MLYLKNSCNKTSRKHYEKTKPKNIRIEKGKESQIKDPENTFNKIIEENFPNLMKELLRKVHEAYRTQNRMYQKKVPLPDNNQNNKYTEQRKAIYLLILLN